LSFIRYVEDAPKAKTKVWKVLAKESDVLLGVVKWYGPWRQYSFFPITGKEKQLCPYCGSHTEPVKTIFEKTCLGDLGEFLVAQNRIYKEGRRRTK
jgi:hypothetical protein